ncbi:unnamed protein product [Adineta steineri]|uniref:NHL repeat containing protein n=1 Tax=Adineta steineri TaxID=433720 RepID=A0A814BZ16_9BILA|nr:unnamed protein product [Adineta steineri]
MSSFLYTPNSYYPIDDSPNNNPNSINNNKPTRNLFRWILLTLAVGILCIFVLTIIITIIIIIFKKKSTHHNYQNSSLNKTEMFLNISKRIKNNTSFTCQLPANPNYKENCTIVAGVLSTSDDELNRLQGPTSVYLDKERNIYVADTTNHRIRKYIPGNSDEGETLIDETSNIYYPRCLFIDQESNYLFFLDQDIQANYRVQVIQLNSNPLKRTILIVGNQTRSYGMSLDENFNIYVSEYNHHRIVKWLSPNYEQYLIIVGNDKNQLTYPRSIYIDQITNDLYVADKNQIQRWLNNSNESKIVMQGGLLCPRGIEYDCHGNLYISQDKTIKLINNKTNLAGIDIIGIQFYFHWVLNSRKTDELSNPEGIYLDKTNGDLYVVDPSFNLVEKFTTKD